MPHNVDVRDAASEDRAMATPEPVAPSRRLAQAAAAERARLESELAIAEQEVTGLRKRIENVEKQASTIRQRLQLLDQLGATDAKAPSRTARPRLVPPEREPANGWLRGAAIRQAAVRILAASANPHREIHYMNWLELLYEAGYAIPGRDPAATFLTQLGRSPVVVRADQPGTYVLDLKSPMRLRESLMALNEELLALHHGQQTIEQIASARDRRTELISEIARVERNLEEALAAIGFDDSVEQTEQL
jgi:hypothetical protein